MHSPAIILVTFLLLAPIIHHEVQAANTPVSTTTIGIISANATSSINRESVNATSMTRSLSSYNEKDKTTSTKPKVINGTEWAEVTFVGNSTTKGVRFSNAL